MVNVYFFARFMSKKFKWTIYPRFQMACRREYFKNVQELCSLLSIS